jgi:hypothetical protein
VTAVGGLILAIICIATVGLAAALALVSLTNCQPHWLLITARAIALLTAGGCFLIASLHQIAEALTP